MAPEAPEGMQAVLPIPRLQRVEALSRRFLAFLFWGYRAGSETICVFFARNEVDPL